MAWFKFSVKYYDYDDGKGELVSRVGVSMANSFRDAIDHISNWFGDSIESFSIEWLSEDGVPLDMEDNEDNRLFIDELEAHINQMFK